MLSLKDEERVMGRDSHCVIVREAAVGVRVAMLELCLLTLIPFSVSHDENEALTPAAGTWTCTGTMKFTHICCYTLVLFVSLHSFLSLSSLIWLSDFVSHRDR